MDAFYLTVLSIALVLLIILLTYLGIKMRKSAASLTYPPTAASCPNYWSVVPDNGYCIYPMPMDTSLNIGNYDSTNGYLNPSATPGLDTNLRNINFNDGGWLSKGTSSICAKKNWADTFGVQWDGVTNYNSC